MRSPDAFDDVQVGAADARATDADDHIVRLLDLWVGNILHRHP